MVAPGTAEGALHKGSNDASGALARKLFIEKGLGY
jgi:hypothetical protein